MHCLPALNGATGSLGNLPECLTARSALTAGGSPLPTTTHAFVLLAAVASERAFGYTGACSRSPIPRSPRFAICATAPGPIAGRGLELARLLPRRLYRGDDDRAWLHRRADGRAGARRLATGTAERVVVGRREHEAVRVRITAQGTTTCCPPTTREIRMSLWIVFCGLLIVTLPRNMGRPVLSTGVGAPFPTARRDQGDLALNRPQIPPSCRARAVPRTGIVYNSNAHSIRIP